MSEHKPHYGRKYVPPPLFKMPDLSPKTRLKEATERLHNALQHDLSDTNINNAANLLEVALKDYQRSRITDDIFEVKQ